MWTPAVGTANTGSIPGRSLPRGCPGRDSAHVTLTRRHLLGAVGASGLLAAGASRWLPEEPALAAPTLPAPAHSGIEHVVVVMMENRSFDHFLGWLPGADGRQADLSYLDSSNQAHATYRLA